MAEKLDGTVALVTGASSGIGEATARALAGGGATVVAVARRTERLEALAGEIAADGGRCVALGADLTDADQACAVVERAVAELGRLDTLVNNAGVMLLGPAADAPLEEWDRMVQLNARALLHVTHAALPHLLHAAEHSERQVADLVNISSVAGRVARSGSGVYNLTKFGVTAFSESLRQEFARRHLRVSAVEPGAVRTELTTHLREEIRRQARERFSFEVLEAEDIADIVVYVVTRPRRVAVNEVLVRPTEQDF